MIFFLLVDYCAKLTPWPIRQIPMNDADTGRLVLRGHRSLFLKKENSLKAGQLPSPAEAFLKLALQPYIYFRHHFKLHVVFSLWRRTLFDYSIFNY